MIELKPARRDLLKGLAMTSAATLLPSKVAAATAPSWEKVRRDFKASRELLNLNNAGVSPQPLIVQDAMIRAYRFANEIPDVNMWSVLDETRGRTKQKLAAIADCSPDEMALNRNATEGLCTVIHGIDLKAGDEVIVSPWDYDSMRHAWESRAKRHGIVLRLVDFDPMASDDAIVAAYSNAMNGKTRVLHLTHMLHYTGRVLPVAELCKIARAKGIQTVVDAAQSFAQMPVSFRQIGCDYMAASLHKWLSAPFGTGMLIVRADRIDALWPLLAPYEANPKGIAKIDGWNLGTYSSPAEHAIEPAIDYHQSIGTERIHGRLRELTAHWVSRAKDIPGFKLLTPLTLGHSSAVTVFSIKGKTADEIEKALREKHRIRVRSRKQGDFQAVRVSPHIYTSFAELDRFTQALEAVAKA